MPRPNTVLLFLSFSLMLRFSVPNAIADAACGPGMRMVGMQTLPGGPIDLPPVQIPACAPESGGQPSTEPEDNIVLSPLNAAVVWWNEEDGTPRYSYTVSRLYSTAATEDAMLHCFLSGGWNCRVGITAAGGWIAISKAADGSLFAETDAKKKAAQKRALATCEAQHSGCKIEKLIRNNK